MDIAKNIHKVQELEKNVKMKHKSISKAKRDQITIAVNFGTIFSSIAYTVIANGVSPRTISAN